LEEPIKFIATASGFVIAFSGQSGRAGRKLFDVKQRPGNSVFGRFRFTCIMAAKTILDVRT
jgi:hypothetical protein